MNPHNKNAFSLITSAPGIVKQIIVCLASCLILVSCTAGITPTPLPEPQLWNVQFTPTLAWMGTELNRCTLQQANTALQVSELPANTLHPGKADFLLRWDAPATLEENAVVIGWDELLIIVHPQNPISQISLSELHATYSGKIISWAGLSAGSSRDPIQVWSQASGEDIRDVFDRLFEENFSQSPSTWLAPDPKAIRQAVAVDPAAIGYLPKRWLDGTVKAVDVSGVSPEKIRRPVLAITAREPQGSQKAWLGCLTSRNNP